MKHQRFAVGVLGVVVGCRQLHAYPEFDEDHLARLPDRPMTLSMTQIAPDQVAGFRIVGGLASTDVTIVRGAAEQTTCPPPLNGACVDLGSATQVGTATTDAEGTILFEVTMPGTIPVGTDVAFQAVTTDSAGVSYVSNVVERRILETTAYDVPPATNILLLLLDDVGVDRFASYGATHPATTPVIDGIAANGVVFTNAWATPLCEPTRAALQTGRYGRRTGYGHNADIFDSTIELDPNLMTIAELVEHSPFVTYETAFVGKWHLSGWDSASSTLGPIVQGWDWWSGTMANLYGWHGPRPVGDLGYYQWQKVDTNGVVTTETTYATTDQVDDALERLAVLTEPWMLEVAFSAAHSPWQLPPVDLHTNAGLTAQSDVSDLHRALLEAADTEIGRLLAGIPIDVLDRTTIFVIGDNGSPSVTLEGEDPDWTESKNTLWDGGIRVPFIVSGPLVGMPGSTTQALAHVVDVFPTIARIAGVDTSVLRESLDPLQSLELDGFRLHSVLDDPTAPSPRKSLYSEKFKPGGAGPFADDTRVIRNATHKLEVNGLCGDERFFEYVAGAEDEGDDLLDGALTPEQQTSLDALRAEIATLVDGMSYDATTWPDSTETGGCPGDTGDTGP